MSERIKLQEPGSEFVMTVASIIEEEIENTAYLKFSDGSSELLVPTSSVVRQFERLDVKQWPDIRGLTIKFSRSTKLSKYGKPFWNLDIATPADAKPAPAPKRIQRPAPVTADAADTITEFDEAVPGDDVLPAEDYPLRQPGEEPENLSPESQKIIKARQRRDSYLRLWDQVAAHHLPWQAKGVLVTDQGINATTATIWIDLGGAGLL